MGRSELVMRVQYFGDRWDAPMLDDAVQVATPVGEPCLYCREPIVAGEQGAMVVHIYAAHAAAIRPAHRECHLRAVLGGIAHVQGRCTCCGGQVDPDDGLPYRESARRVLAHTQNVSLEYILKLARQPKQ